MILTVLQVVGPFISDPSVYFGGYSPTVMVRFPARDHWPVSVHHWPVSGDHWPVSVHHWPVFGDHWPVSGDHWPVFQGSLAIQYYPHTATVCGDRRSWFEVSWNC